MTRASLEQSLGDRNLPELFRTVGDICSIVSTVATTRQLLEISLKQTLELFAAERGSIFILDENGRDLILKIAQGMKLQEEQQMVKKLGEGVVGRVAIDKKPIFVDDITQDDRFKNYKARVSYKTPSFICAPLLLKDKLIGVINISDKGSGRRFCAEELQILDFLASQIALNYHRLQLYQKFKEILRESQSLKSELGKSSQEATHLKKQIVVQEKFATIGKLAGGIAHEFNNPLDGIMRYTNLCLEHAKDDEMLRGYLLEIKQGLNRMANIVKSLLACSRQTDPTLKRTSANIAVKQALQSSQTEFLPKRIVIEKQLDSNLPELIDYGLERVVSNLLRNAADAITQSGLIKVATYLEGADVAIKIQDTGCGIRESELEKIFEPFYTTKDIDKGCGLGLTIVTEIIKNYSGKIRVESTEGQGTTFTVTIPADNDEK